MSINPEPSPTVVVTRPQNEESSLARWASRLILGIARHWLAIFNLAWGLYVALPFFAPILMHFGLAAPAQAIYTIYSFLCHQLPSHSYFLFGGEAAPNLATIEAGGMAVGLGPLAQRHFVGNPLLGYKVAICQRDVAIYGAVFAAGLLFGGWRTQLRGLPLRWYLLLLIPIAVDGGTQLFGLRESNWLLRSLTGILFGAGSVWLAYPYIEEAIRDIIATEEHRQTLSSI